MAVDFSCSVESNHSKILEVQLLCPTDIFVRFTSNSLCNCNYSIELHVHKKCEVNQTKINASIDNKDRKSRRSGSDNFILHNDKSWPKSGTFIKIYAVHLICISKAVPWREKKRVQLYDINHLFKVKEVTLRKSITDFTTDKQLCAAFMASLLAYIGHIGSLNLFFL